MRTIKFRAWCKELNGFLDITAFETIKGEIDGIFHDGDYIGYDKEDIKLMQYTGLKDKNGKEIYEGDIIEVKHPHKNRYYKGEIIFEFGAFEANGFDFPHYDNPSDFKEGLEYVEVIGNIYENADLIVKEVKE